MRFAAFPIDINEDSFLGYYFHSDTLFGLAPVEADPSGANEAAVPSVRYKWGGVHYNPAFVSWWGIINLHRKNFSAFHAAVRWLHRNAVGQGEAVVWPYAFDWIEGRSVLKAPWISAMAQGLAISALVRSWRLGGPPEDLLLAKRGAEAFWVPVGEGGLLDRSAGMCFLEEYPAMPFPRVLDGFCFALLALHDLHLELGNHGPYADLFTQCLDTLEAFLPKWDFFGIWSWYGTEGFLCTLQYQSLNRMMLQVLYRLSGRQTLRRYAQMWDSDRLTPSQWLFVRLVARATLTLRRIQYNRLRRRYYGKAMA